MRGLLRRSTIASWHIDAVAGAVPPSDLLCLRADCHENEVFHVHGIFQIYRKLIMRSLFVSFLFVSCLVGLAVQAQAQPRPRNVVLFVADGLRAGMVTPQNAPAMDRLMKAGVRFTNTHSLFPTFTMPNATAMATGHMLGDTGEFGNTIYTAFQVPGAGDSLTPFLESDPVLGDVDEHFSGNYLNKDTVLKAARAAGLSTASIGKLGPALVFDHTERSGQQTILVDDSTGRKGGIPLGDDLRARLSAAGLPTEAPSRGANGQAGGADAPGTLAANVEQQRYFAEVATKAVLPLFKERQKPFVLVFWSRDHDNLATLQAGLREQGLEDTTDVILTSDHGFSTISKDSATSYAATQTYKGVVAHQLPPGLVAIDLAHDLGMPLLDPDTKGTKVEPGSFPSRANGLIGSDLAKPEVVVATNGGSDLVYVPSGDKALARRTVEALSRQDYVSGLFVSDTLGPIPGTLPLSSIALDGSAVTPMPAIVVNFRTFSTGLRRSDHLRRRDRRHRAAAGSGHARQLLAGGHPQRHGRDGPELPRPRRERHPGEQRLFPHTIAQLLDLQIPSKGRLVGRVLTEAMANGAQPSAETKVLRSEPDACGQMTILKYQTVSTTRYFDVAGYPGRTLGLEDEAPDMVRSSSAPADCLRP